jgi:hypothetical protein
MGREVTGEDRKLRVVVPEEPARLTPGAARALLRILLKADARRTQSGEKTTQGGHR